MSASDHLNDEQFFHGTTREGLEAILPPNKHKSGVVFPHDTDPSYSYATTNPDHAWHYAEKAWGAGADGIPRVYQVAPLGDVEPDPTVDSQGRPRSNFAEDRRSRAGWRVLSELQMPEHLGDPEDWR